MILATCIRPFDAKQLIHVINDNQETAETCITSFEEYGNTVIQLMTEYNITELQLHGPRQFCEKTAKDVREAEMAKYNDNHLIINIK